MEDHRKFSKGKMSNENREHEVAVIKVQLDVIMKWLQERMNEDQRYGWRIRKCIKWNLLQKRWNSKLINQFRELEKRHISLLEKERLKGIQS